MRHQREEETRDAYKKADRKLGINVDRNPMIATHP